MLLELMLDHLVCMATINKNVLKGGNRCRDKMKVEFQKGVGREKEDELVSRPLFPWNGNYCSVAQGADPS